MDKFSLLVIGLLFPFPPNKIKQEIYVQSWIFFAAVARSISIWEMKLNS